MEEHASVIPYAEYRAALGNNCRRSAYGGDRGKCGREIVRYAAVPGHLSCMRNIGTG